MALKPLYQQVALDKLGYIGGWVEVRINPSGDAIRAFTEAWADLLEARAKKQAEQSPPDKDDDNQFIAALSRLLGRCQVGDEVYDLTTPEGLRAFEKVDGDPQIIWYAREALFALRERRVGDALTSFRGSLGAIAEYAGGNAGTPAAASDSG